MSYEVVLFDFDHTLLDSDASLAGAFEVTMRSVGVDDPWSVHDHFDAINQALWRRVEAQELGPNEVRVRRFEQLVSELGLDGDPESMATTFVEGLVEFGELIEGAAALLDDLAGRARLAMVTNGIGAVQRGRIERLSLDDYFEAVAISGELGVSKPGTAIFDRTLSAMEIDDRSTVVMVGDSVGSDIAGGANAGVDTIWYNPAGASNGDGPLATHVVTGLSEISSLV